MSDAAPAARFVVVAVLDVPESAVAAFQRYEDVVLPLLARHGGEVERRLRTDDGTTEVHVLSFASDAAYRGYSDDPERVDAAALLGGADLGRRVLKSLTDVR